MGVEFNPHFIQKNHQIKGHLKKLEPVLLHEYF
jgi:hypothetical protein